jgi:hypothetical protein
VKEEKTQNPYIYLLELTIKISGDLEFVYFSGEFGPFFSLKILCLGRNHIFQVKIWRNFAQNQNTETPNRTYSQLVKNVCREMS